MDKIRAYDKIQKNKKKIIIMVIILIIIYIVLSTILYVFSPKKEQENISYENIQTVKDVLNYYKCKYISEKESTVENFNIDIQLVFRYPLYEGETSNEKFFNQVIEDVAKVLNYASFRMIDDENSIKIEVVCENRKISKIIINDREDYFIYMNSQLDLKRYIELDTIDFQIESPEIQSLINNRWESKISFGTRESIFDGYYNYFDEGISTRAISGKIYNIVFNKKYTGNVVNGIFPGVDIKAIKTKLGEPAFEDENLKIIGYKGKDIYVFFTDEEISVYRVSNDDTTEFFKLVDKFLGDELDLLDFMNELTYLWPDYEEYNYTSNSVFITYPLKGIDIKIGYEETDGIILYNNVNAELTKVERYLENTEFIAKLGVDNVFESEKRRVEKNKNYLNLCTEFIEQKEDDEQEKIGKSLKFGVYADLDVDDNIIKLCFVSKDGNNPNRELNDNIDTYLWLNSDIFLYSQNKTGIYYFNVLTGEKNTLITGEETYELKSFKDGILKYDNEEIVIQY